MKPHCKFASFLAAIGCSVLPASADPFYWDGSNNVTLGASDNTNTASQAWLSGGLWDDGTTSAALGSWTAGDSAVFGGSAASQTITLGSTITVGNLTFGGGADGSGTSGTAYTISGGTLTFSSTNLTANTATVITSAISNAGTATVNGQGAITLRGNISGAGTLTHSGSGLLTLSAADGNRDSFNALSGSGSFRIGTSGSSFYGQHASMSGLAGTVTMAGLVYNRTNAEGSASAAFVQESGGVWLFGNDDGNKNTNYQMGSLSGSGTLAGTGYTGTRTGTKTLSIGALNTNTTYSGSIANGYAGGGGTVVLTKVGTGTLTLSGSSSYTGGTTISSGSIIATHGNALGTGGTVTLNDANTGSNNTSLLLGGVDMGRAITIASHPGSGTTTLGASGAVAVPTFSGAITLNKDVILDGGINTDRLTFTGAINGTGNVTIAGTGRVTFLQATNGFNGNLTINNGSILQTDWGDASGYNYIPDTSLLTLNGTLKIAQKNAAETISGLAGNGTFRAHEGVGSSAVTLIINSSASNTFSGVMENGGASGSTVSLTKTGAGTQTLSGSTANSYTGLTTVNAGTLILDKNDGVTAIASNILVNGTGTLATSDNKSGRISDSSNVTIDSSGASFQFGSNQNDTINTLAVNNGGTVNIGGGGSNLRPNGGITSSGGGSITMSAGGAGLNFNGATRTVTVSNNTLAVSAPISSGGLTKSGNGTLSLSGANTYTGTTTISGGTLALTGSGSLASSNIIVGASTTFDVSGVSGGYTSGATQTISGTGNIVGNITVGGTLTPGNSPGDLGFTDNLGLTNTLVLEITGITTGMFDRLVGDGANTLTLGGILNLNNTGYTPVLNDTITVFSNWQSITGSFTSITGADLGGGLSWDTSALGTTGVLTVIPEPRAALLGGLGLLMLLRRRRAR